MGNMMLVGDFDVGWPVRSGRGLQRHALPRTSFTYTDD